MTMQLEEQLNLAPLPIQAILVQENLGPIITLISKNFGVDADTAIDIENIIVDMFLGVLHPKKFLEELGNLNIPQEAAKDLTRELNKNIFDYVKGELKTMHDIKGDLFEEILGEGTAPVSSFADDVLGTHKKVNTGAVLIKPETGDIKAAKEALSTSEAPSKSTPMTAPPQNLPGVTVVENKEAVVPKTIIPKPEKSSAYPVPPVSDSEKTGPSDSDDVSGDVKIPENIFEAKLRKVSESLEGSSEPKTSRPEALKPSKPATDPYREPID